MTLTAKALSTGLPAATDPVPSTHELLTRAEQLVPELIGRQSETEARAQYSRAIHEQFSAAGFYKILVPRRYGGYQLGSDAFFGVSMVLARGCPSTAWMFSRGAIHALTAASLFSERAQDEIFAGGEFIAPATLVPGGTAERASDGGWLLNGIWANCSGAAYASHFIGHLMVEPPMGGPQLPMMFIAPRAEWRSVDDGDPQLGLRGSGIGSVAIVNGRIPDYFALLGTQLFDVHGADGTPGRVLHGNPEYSGSAFSYLVLERASLAVGIAKGALDAYEELLRSRKTLVPPVADRYLDGDYQHWFGEAIGLVAAAESALADAVRQWRDGCSNSTGRLDRATELRLAAVCRQVIRLCWQGVEHYLFPTAGTSAARPGDRLERLWRDMAMLHGRSGSALAMSTIASRDLARSRLGLC
ncbi:MAG TPA: acyl-CoA dehydrogenase family protein [Jatrophihabitans sp.]|nr:acyl-CoA dehydrogenase family protein [Jatrophihabitans sp.]